jgi:hypothetical protein
MIGLLLLARFAILAGLLAMAIVLLRGARGNHE